MKFPFLCNYDGCSVLNPLDYAEQDLYRHECVVCARKNAYALSQEKFEILFDFGARAFLDGYYREAVTDFATALERFFEFFVKTVFYERGLSSEGVESTWKLMSRQSERQLGAFATLYLLSTGRSPNFLRSEPLQIDFRNKVVHKGYMPSQEEAVEYAEMAYSLIRRLLGELWETAPNSVGRIREDLIVDLGKQAEDEGSSFTVYSYPGMFGVLRFAPFFIAHTQRTYSSYTEAEERGAKTAWEHYRTDLGFEDTLKARKMFLEAAFYDEDRHGSEGSRMYEDVEENE